MTIRDDLAYTLNRGSKLTAQRLRSLLGGDTIILPIEKMSKLQALIEKFHPAACAYKNYYVYADGSAVKLDNASEHRVELQIIDVTWALGMMNHSDLAKIAAALQQPSEKLAESLLNFPEQFSAIAHYYSPENMHPSMTWSRINTVLHNRPRDHQGMEIYIDDASWDTVVQLLDKLHPIFQHQDPVQDITWYFYADGSIVGLRHDLHASSSRLGLVLFRCHSESQFSQVMHDLRYNHQDLLLLQRALLAHDAGFREFVQEHGHALHDAYQAPRGDVADIVAWQAACVAHGAGMTWQRIQAGMPANSDVNFEHVSFYEHDIPKVRKLLMSCSPWYHCEIGDGYQELYFYSDGMIILGISASYVNACTRPAWYQEACDMLQPHQISAILAKLPRPHKLEENYVKHADLGLAYNRHEFISVMNFFWRTSACPMPLTWSRIMSMLHLHQISDASIALKDINDIKPLISKLAPVYSCKNYKRPHRITWYFFADGCILSLDSILNNLDCMLWKSEIESVFADMDMDQMHELEAAMENHDLLPGEIQESVATQVAMIEENHGLGIDKQRQQCKKFYGHKAWADLGLTFTRMRSMLPADLRTGLFDRVIKIPKNMLDVSAFMQRFCPVYSCSVKQNCILYFFADHSVISYNPHQNILAPDSTCMYDGSTISDQDIANLYQALVSHDLLPGEIHEARSINELTKKYPEVFKFFQRQAYMVQASTWRRIKNVLPDSKYLSEVPCNGMPYQEIQDLLEKFQPIYVVKRNRVLEYFYADGAIITLLIFDDDTSSVRYTFWNDGVQHVLASLDSRQLQELQHAVGKAIAKTHDVLHEVSRLTMLDPKYDAVREFFREQSHDSHHIVWRRISSIFQRYASINCPSTINIQAIDHDELTQLIMRFSPIYTCNTPHVVDDSQIFYFFADGSILCLDPKYNHLTYLNHQNNIDDAFHDMTQQQVQELQDIIVNTGLASQAWPLQEATENMLKNRDLLPNAAKSSQSLQENQAYMETRVAKKALIDFYCSHISKTSLTWKRITKIFNSACDGERYIHQRSMTAQEFSQFMARFMPVYTCTLPWPEGIPVLAYFFADGTVIRVECYSAPKFPEHHMVNIDAPWRFQNIIAKMSDQDLMSLHAAMLERSPAYQEFIAQQD